MIQQQLKHERLVLKLSLQDVADLVGTSTGVIWKWENDKRCPSLSNVEKWANALGYEVVLHKL